MTWNLTGVRSARPWIDADEIRCIGTRDSQYRESPAPALLTDSFQENVRFPGGTLQARLRRYMPTVPRRATQAALEGIAREADSRSRRRVALLGSALSGEHSGV
jgi:hypothetical protein